MAFAGGAYGVAGDAREGDPSLVAVADEDALLARLHAEMEAHLGPLIAAIGAATAGRSGRCGAAPATVWAGRFSGSARSSGCASGRGTSASRCMRSGGPLAVGAGFRVLEHAGIAEPTRNRRGCCLIYRVAGNDTCFTCPLTPRASDALGWRRGRPRRPLRPPPLLIRLDAACQDALTSGA